MTFFSFEKNAASQENISEDHLTASHKLFLDATTTPLQKENNFNLGSYAIEGGLTGTGLGLGLAAKSFAGDVGVIGASAAASRAVNVFALSALKGFAVATLDAGVDLGLQKMLGTDINGHNLFKPTGIEMIGMTVAAAYPMDIRLKLGLLAASWLAGRVEDSIEA